MDEVLKPDTDFRMGQEVQGLDVVCGFSFFGQGQNNALMFASLKPWGGERSAAESSAESLPQRAMGLFMQNDGAIAFVI